MTGKALSQAGPRKWRKVADWGERTRPSRESGPG